MCFPKMAGKALFAVRRFMTGCAGRWKISGLTMRNGYGGGCRSTPWRHFLITFLRMSDISDKKAKDVAGHLSAFVNDQYTHLDAREFEDVRKAQKNLLAAPKKNGGETKAGNKLTKGKTACQVQKPVAGKGRKPAAKTRTA
jgi:hypothetical protein